MEAMDRVHVLTEPNRTFRPTSSYSGAWLLDPEPFHTEFDQLYAGIESSEGLTRLRWAATQTWRSTDVVTHDYVDMLRTESADDWEDAYDEKHLADWYRVLMASYVEPITAIKTPKALKERLPLLGFSASESRRLAYGRELQGLVEAFGSLPVVAQIAPFLSIGSRGWLSQDDVESALNRLHGLDRTIFRDAQELVPMVEDLHAMLSAARNQPNSVVLLLCD
ncbi:MAG: hypothetical protein WCK41_00070 [Actinomycetes bacterium]